MAIRLRDRRPGGRAFAISTSAMKWIGFLLTCLSSIGVAVLQRGLLKVDTTSLEDLSAAMADPASGAVSLVSGAVTCSLLAVMALPLYAKLIYEGWKRMENKNRFFLRLALCALVSEVPFDLAMYGTPLAFEVQDPVWGLLLCAVMLEILQLPKPRSRVASAARQVVTAAAALAWVVLLRVYMGPMLVLLVALFYFLEGSKTISTLGGVALTMTQFPAPFGMLFVYFHEPDDGKVEKYPDLFYILYPAQLLVFGVAGLLMQGM